MDFSCRLRFQNNTAQDFELGEHKVTDGRWDPPPVGIPKMGVTHVGTTDLRSSWLGSGGQLHYKLRAFSTHPETSFDTSFGCPTGLADNWVNNGVTPGAPFVLNYRSKSDEGWHENSYPKKGHPLTVEYTLDYAPIGTKGYIHYVDAVGRYTLQNTRGEVVNRNSVVWSITTSFDDGNYSLAPMAFTVGDVDNLIRVAIVLDGVLATQPFSVAGYLRGQKVFQSETVRPNPTGSFGGVPIMPVPVKVVKDTSTPCQLAGDFVWIVTLNPGSAKEGQYRLPGTTRLELYWTYGLPTQIFTKGVYVCILRDLFFGLATNPTREAVVINIARKAFSPGDPAYRKQYDTVHGAPGFMTSSRSGNFRLKKFFDSPNHPVNCYDQAGLVQISLAALSIESTWLYTEPFGFINTTDLIGIGQCNNPFFNGVGHLGRPVVGINEQGRSKFANHAVIRYEGKIIDATQGPCIGDQTPEAYLNSSIDMVTTLYKGSKWATVANMNECDGVTGVEVVPPARLPEGSPAMSRTLSLLSTPGSLASARFFEGARGHAFGDAVASADYVVTYREDTLGHGGVSIDLSLRSEGHDAQAQLWVSSEGAEEAHLRLLTAVESFVSIQPDAEIRPVPELGNDAIMIGEAAVFWRKENVSASVVTHPAPGHEPRNGDPMVLARKLNQAIESQANPAEARRLSSRSAPFLGSRQAAVGETVEFAFPEGGGWVDFDLSGSGRIQILSIETGVYRFQAEEPGTVLVTFLVGNPESLAVTEYPFEIEVVG